MTNRDLATSVRCFFETSDVTVTETGVDFRCPGFEHDGEILLVSIERDDKTVTFKVDAGGFELSRTVPMPTLAVYVCFAASEFMDDSPFCE